MKICLNCRFWEQNVFNTSAGLCRRYPPKPPSERRIPDVERGEGFGSWAVTASNDWCGEFKHKPGDYVPPR